MLALARWAGLRRGEALNLEWHNIDWEHHRLRVISREDWDVKDKEVRVVPICPELNDLLLSALDGAAERQTRVIAPDSVVIKNVSRDFDALCRRAGVARYAKPVHALRKSCITDWAGCQPAHVVREWAGHSDMDTTDRYYLKVSEAEYEKAAAQSASGLAEKLAKNGQNEPVRPDNENRRQCETDGG